MQCVQTLKKLLIPCGTLVAVAEGREKSSSESKLVRPSELPIYVQDSERVSIIHDESSEEITKLESVISTCRKELWILYDYYKVYRDQVTNFVQTGVEHSKSTLYFLQEEDNILPRVGAIALGSVAGFLVAARRGKFKKLVYSTAGGISVAALCYPKETVSLTEESLLIGRKYFAIGYNFIYGVTPENLRKPLPSPESSAKISSASSPPSESKKPSGPGAGADQSVPEDKHLYTTRS